jgi:hypothetical protein
LSSSLKFVVKKQQMAKAIPLLVRQRIIELCKNGETVQSVSSLLGLGYDVTAKIWRAYRKEGDLSLKSRYNNCGRKPFYDEQIKESVRSHLNDNEQLGAPIIRSRLLAEGKFEKVPHERTIQRWWRQAHINKPRGRRPTPSKNYSSEPHDTWQVDGKENIKILDDTEHCYLSFADESTCSFLKGVVFPLYTSDASGEPT